MNFPGKIPTPPESFKNKVLIAKKVQHKGALFGHISNGGGEIDLGHGYGLQFVAVNEQFVTLQLFHYALDSRVETQSWQKSKVVFEKKVDDAPKEVVIESKISTESLL